MILMAEESTGVLEINNAHCLMRVAAEDIEGVYVSEAHLQTVPGETTKQQTWQRPTRSSSAGHVRSITPAPKSAW